MILIEGKDILLSSESTFKREEHTLFDSKTTIGMTNSLIGEGIAETLCHI